MPNANIKQSIKVILGVCLVCSFFVSTAAVWLNSIQQQNRRLDRIGNILSVAGLAGHRKNIEQIYRDRIVPVMIDLASGERVEPRRFDDVLNIENFDIETLASDSDYGVAIPPEQDIAKIKRRPRYMVVYLVKKDNRFDQVILPVYGKGLWSTLYGFLALNNDLNTIAGITFYQHGETPGLGGEIENPQWQQSWRGKRAFNSAGEVIIEVVRGEVEANSPDAKHQIDSLSGATLTSRGVDNLIHYWLGEHGYGPLLDRLSQGALTDLTAAGKQE